MRIPMRAALRLALTGWLGLAGLSLVAAQGRAATPPEKILPDSTIAFVKINNAAALREAFRQSQFGQLWNDPAVKAWKEDLAERIDEASKSLKEKLGVTYRELLELPQGTGRDRVPEARRPQAPASLLLIIADAGKNAATMADVLTKATEAGRGQRRQGLDRELQGRDPPRDPAPARARTRTARTRTTRRTASPSPRSSGPSQGSVFYIGSDVDAVKDLIAHAQGRDDSLAGNESFVQAVKKLGSDAPGRLVRRPAQAAQAGRPAGVARRQGERTPTRCSRPRR